VVGVSKQIESNPSRVSFDPRQVGIEALDEIADERDMSRAELVRGTLADLIGSEGGDDRIDGEIHKPDNEELRDAFEALLDLSDHPLGPRPVGVDEATDRLYNRSCPKTAVKRRLLKPLAELGFISVRAARVVVHRRTVEQVEAAEAQADVELEQIQGSDDSGIRTAGIQIAPKHRELRKYQRAGLTPPIEYIGWVGAQTIWNDNGGASA
jgi:hypothetical protein